MSTPSSEIAKPHNKKRQPRAQKAKRGASLPEQISKHGNLVYDVSLETLIEPERAERATRKVFKRWTKEWIPELTGEFERPWLIRILVEVLRAETRGRTIRAFLGDGAGIKKDTSLGHELRRLPFEARILLLLSDKHRIPLEELAIALRTPAESLRTARELALRRIESKLRPESISDLPQVTLTPSLITHPLRDPSYRFNFRSVFRRTTWQRAPWYWRSGLETLTIGLIAFAVVASAPTLRALYEKGLSRRLEGFDLAAVTTDDGVPTSPAASSNAPGAEEPAASAEDPEDSPENEFEEIDAEEEKDSKSSAKPLSVRNSEIWRMSLSVENPATVRPKIISILGTLGLPGNTPGLQGFIAPGGIQFDLLVTKDLVLPLKEKLEELSKESSSTPVVRAAFTWYRHRSKKPIPEGRVRVVIWLSP